MEEHVLISLRLVYRMNPRAATVGRAALTDQNVVRASPNHGCVSNFRRQCVRLHCKLLCHGNPLTGPVGSFLPSFRPSSVGGQEPRGAPFETSLHNNLAAPCIFPQ